MFSIHSPFFHHNKTEKLPNSTGITGGGSREGFASPNLRSQKEEGHEKSGRVQAAGDVFQG